MPTKVPTALQLHRTPDENLNRVQDNVRTALDPTLQAVNSLWDGTGSPSVASVTSASGFKTFIGPYLYRDTAAAAGVQVNAMVTMYDVTAAAASNQTQRLVMPLPGSVVGISLIRSSATDNTTSTVAMQVASAPASTGTVSTLVPNTSVLTPGVNQGYTTFAKGRYPFGAGDQLFVRFTPSAAGVYTLRGAIFVEFAA